MSIELAPRKPDVKKVVTLNNEGEVRTLKLTVNIEGSEASILSVYIDQKGRYNINHRETHEGFERQGHASQLLQEAISIIGSHLKRESVDIYIETNQKSVISWAEKNGFKLKGSNPPTEDEVLYEPDEDTFYMSRYELTRKITPQRKLEAERSSYRNRIESTL